MENSPKTKVKTKAEGCSGCSKLRKTCETLRKAVKGKDEENDKLKQKIQDLETEIARLMIETTRAQNCTCSKVTKLFNLVCLCQPVRCLLTWFSKVNKNYQWNILFIF